MKKTLIIAALIIGLILFAGGYSQYHHRTSIGGDAPALVLPGVDSAVTSDRHRGDYILVNFWNSTDAPSRQAANRYRAWKRRHPLADIRIIGVNFDASPALFNEIVRLDSLEPAKQFHVSGDTAKAIINNYGLKGGYGAVLIDPEGKVVTYNPADEQLDALFVLR